MLHFVPPGFVGLDDMREAVVTRLFGREWAGSIDICEDTITGEISVVDGLPGPDENKGHELAKRFDAAQEHVLRALSDGVLTAEVDVGGARLALPMTFWKTGAGWRTLQIGIIPEDLSADPSLAPIAGCSCFIPREQFDRWLTKLTAGLEVEPHGRSGASVGGAMPSHHENHGACPWLKCEELELKKIINIARGAPVEDWPPEGEWKIQFKMLKNAVLRRKLPAILVCPERMRLSIVALVDVGAFLAKQQGNANWDWLRDFCKIWADEAGVALAGPSPEHSNAQQITTIAAETRCKDWLIEFMSKGGPPDRLKPDYRSEAKERWGVGTKAFDRAWHNAIVETGNVKWSTPGPRSLPLNHHPN